MLLTLGLLCRHEWLYGLSHVIKFALWIYEEYLIVFFSFLSVLLLLRIYLMILLSVLLQLYWFNKIRLEVVDENWKGKYEWMCWCWTMGVKCWFRGCKLMSLCKNTFSLYQLFIAGVKMMRKFWIWKCNYFLNSWWKFILFKDWKLQNILGYFEYSRNIQVSTPWFLYYFLSQYFSN